MPVFKSYYKAVIKPWNDIGIEEKMINRTENPEINPYIYIYTYDQLIYGNSVAGIFGYPYAKTKRERKYFDPYLTPSR